jgi:uncharacterized protein YndB with AHSA1/START domain
VTTNKTPETGADCEIVISRDFNAPREMVWDAMTNRKHVVHWWGPRGFTTTVESMELRPGGVWKLTLHGPDGTDYQNKSVFKEIAHHERIVFAHEGKADDGRSTHFLATWSFDALSPVKTRVTIRMVFDTPEDRTFVVKEFGAIEGGKQTLMRLGEHLSGKLSEPFIITREYAAPRWLVWKAWSERDALMQWFGPKGFKMTHAKLDFRPNGMFHYGMVSPDGKELWGRFIYREIVPKEKILSVNSFSDKDGGLGRHPFSDLKLPLGFLTQVEFAARGNKTLVTLTTLPLDAIEEERQAFDSIRDSMKQGWGGTLDQLGSHLKANPPQPQD